MDGLLVDKVAIITGAGSGVGRAAALLFTRHGAKVMTCDIDKASVEETVAQVEAAGGTARATLCNVANEAEVQGLVAEAVEAFGRLDIMYNNVGITTTKPGARFTRFVDGTVEEMERLQAVNVGGVVNGCRAAIRQFERQGGGGVIVNTSSVAGLIGWGGVVYGSTKGALTILTRSLAMEVAGQGIRVNSVCPAAMMTKFGIGALGPISDETRAHAASIHPLGRTIDPMDCANAALFLVSDLASNITGVNLPVDGGLSAGK